MRRSNQLITKIRIRNKFVEGLEMACCMIRRTLVMRRDYMGFLVEICWSHQEIVIMSDG
jgi:hypothetical protein